MPIPFDVLTERLDLADQLLFGRDRMLQPQDLPGRYGRVIRSIDHILDVLKCDAVLAGGWAVWFHGFVGRVTQDVDVVIPADRVDDFLRTASVSGFERLAQQPGRWPKMIHKETGIQVDLLPEGARPGMKSKPAPTTIRHPSQMGAKTGSLNYIELPALIELKLAAGRPQDEADVVQLIRCHADQLDGIREHLRTTHSDYVAAFDRLADLAREIEP